MKQRYEQYRHRLEYFVNRHPYECMIGLGLLAANHLRWMLQYPPLWVR